ncbi:MAG TPA: TonB-dependent receptor [Gammaproteobacteria bacterium]
MDTGHLSLSRIIRGLLITGAISALPLRGALADDTTPDQTTPPVNGTAQLGKIDVTGTRIKRVDVEAARPITVITAQQIKETGLTSVGDVLQQLPSSGAAVNSQFNNGGSGRSNIDLRNLGSNRLLVLLDGKRVVGGLGGDVDLNTIPVSIIDHIEILQDGASALYGSDAISGVINLITVKRYDGAEANASIGKYDAHGDGGGWDGESEQFDFTLGTSSERGNVVMNASYVTESPVLAGNRTVSKEPAIGAGNTAGSFTTPNGVIFTSSLNGHCPGRATLTSYGTCEMTLIKPRPGRVGQPNGPTLANFRDVTPDDRFNYAPANFLMTPSERTGLFVQSSYDLADNLSFDAQALFNSRKSSEQLAPNTISIGAFGQAKANGQPVGISGKNPYNPFGEDLVASVSQSCIFAATCLSLEQFGRRLSEGGNRVFDQDVENFQFNGGFSGYFRFLGNEWDWDAGYSYGNNYEADLAGGVVNTFHLQEELGTPGAAPCASAGAGCTPMDFFGGDGSITPAMLSYIMFEQHDVVEQTARNYRANTTGQLADLPAGPLNMAIGAEYDETDGFSHPDALVTQGNTAASLIPPTSGRERTVSQYVEFDIPLVADQPFMKDVDLDLANRWSQFKWEGGDVETNNRSSHGADASTGSASLRWQANDQLLLRASWSQGFRIPSISDLFLADSDSFEALTDPCVGAGKAAHCGSGAVVQTGLGGTLPATIGGNTNLTPEHSISETVGFVYSPDWLAGFDFSADYYKIDLENAIGQIPGQLILDGCYVDGIQKYCDLIRRSGGDHSAKAPGVISNVQNLNTNAGGIKTEGIDVSVRYKFPSTSFGDFKAGMDWDFTRQYVATLVFGQNGFSSEELSGTTTDSAGGTSLAGTAQATGGVPKQRANINLAWTYGNWSASWNVEYISHLIEDCNEAIALVPASRCPLTINFPFEQHHVPGNHIGATFYHDVQATYHLDSLDTDFSLGVRNLFDKQPPIAMSAFANSFLPTYYRTPGRFLFASVSVKF